MKASKLLYDIMIATLSLLGTSCTDDTFIDNYSGRVEEGIPVRVQLKFQAEAGQVMTRIAQEEKYENLIENAYVFVFDGGGEIVYRNFFTEGNDLSFADGDDSHSSGIISFDTKSMNDATIVGIANLNTATSGTAFPVTVEDLNEIADLNALKAYVMRMTQASVSRGGLFMMTGYAKDSEGNTQVAIPGSESGQQTLNATLQFERTDAKVKFVVKTSPNPPAGKTWTNFSFVPRTWEVKRVPQQTYLLEAETGDYDGTDAVYFDTSAMPFEETTLDPNNSNLYTGGSFVFYMPENKKTPVNSVTDYAQRDAWDTEKGLDDAGNRTFTNANANSTYVEMTGTLSYQDGGNNLVNADVRFIVHLGYVTSRNGQPVTADPNDYDTERNGFYTYNVTVRGVDDIIVEVRDSRDVRPGYEGDVVYSTTDIFEFDSHYDRRLIKLNKEAIGDDMKWSVNTPFSRGIHDATDDASTIEQSMRDYRWIKFAINADYGVDNNKYVKYPGDQNYNDPFPMNANNDKPSPYYDQTSLYYGNKGNYPDARLLDVNQLIRRLQQEADKSNSTIFFTDTDGEEKVAITVFVDEHLYYNHPLTNQPGEENRSLWKLTTDKEDRQLHIIAQGSQISPDGNSSVVNSTFSFKQRPISTIFNVDKEGLEKAWGLESVMETGRMQKGSRSYGSSTSNGRMNTLDIILGTSHTNQPHWTDVLNTDDHYALNSGYQDPVHACLMRNRDLNGNNIVEADEIRWYLAAIDQLTDIYIGEYALDEKSRLYPANAADRIDEDGNSQVRWHYISSSAYSSDAWILWAEEGASRGGTSGSIKDGKDWWGNDVQNTYFSYRCARNLGLPLNNPDEEPADLIEVIEEGSGFYLIDATNLNVKSRRTNYEVNSLPLHNERSANNLPYAKFRVHANAYGGDGNTPKVEDGSWENWGNDYEWNDWPWYHYQTYRGGRYANGYRIPNQRELLIMTTRLPADAWKTFTDSEGRKSASIRPNYICQTAFSLNGTSPYNNQREGFLWDSNSGLFFLQNNTGEEGYVRPVQDVRE